VLATRSIKKESKLQAIDMAISMIDLTTLEGADTPGKVRSLAAQARRPDPDHTDVPSVAAVCVYPDLVAVAVEALHGSGIAVASVATAFPSGRSSRAVKLADTALAVEAGATEIDMVIDRGAYLSGRYGAVYDEIVAVKKACGSGDRRAHLKAILETGELAGYDDVRRASWLALLAGADVIKTSTGKVSPAATLPVVQVMLQAVRDWCRATGERRGVKAAGGIRTAKDAIRHLVAVHEIAGPEWLTPELFRFGASALLGDLLRQRRTQLEGHYADRDHIGGA
jgi:deoxyribose-phosphate aldolase